MTAYTIVINEAQRKLIIKLMNAALEVPSIITELASKPGEVERNQYGDATMLVDMMQDLPLHEKRDPRNYTRTVPLTTQRRLNHEN